MYTKTRLEDIYHVIFPIRNINIFQLRLYTNKDVSFVSKTANQTGA